MNNKGILMAGKFSRQFLGWIALCQTVIVGYVFHRNQVTDFQFGQIENLWVKLDSSRNELKICESNSLCKKVSLHGFRSSYESCASMFYCAQYLLQCISITGYVQADRHVQCCLMYCYCIVLSLQSLFRQTDMFNVIYCIVTVLYCHLQGMFRQTDMFSISS